jgi:hypothetical protein
MFEPHATRILAAGELPGLRSNIWMGGADSDLGEPIVAAMLEESWVLDCAGRMPSRHAEAAGHMETQVFADVAARPEQFDLLAHIAKDWASALLDQQDEPPRHVFVMCQYGMNRSGLVAGLLLCALGLDAGDAIRRITRARPGALSNTRYRRLLTERRVSHR